MATRRAVAIPPTKPAILALEPRFMFDGAAVADAVEHASETANDASSSVVFVSGDIEGNSALKNSLSANTEVVTLDSSRDGVAQIAEYLAGRENIDAIHILSHGSSAEVFLGDTTLSLETLEQHRADLSRWGEALSEGGDILFYGCDVASGEAGREWVTEISAITGADVAASDDPTGSTGNADWTLEQASGSIEAVSPFVDGVPVDFDGVLAAPTLTGLTDHTFNQNTVAAGFQTIGDGAVFSDSDGTLAGNTHLEITNTANVQNYSESMWLNTDGTGITITGLNGDSEQRSIVAINGTDVGTVGVGEIFNIHFYNTATVADVQTIIRNVTYRNLSESPEASRTIEFKITDTSATPSTITKTITVNITAENEAPRNRTDVTIGSIDNSSSVTTINGDGWFYDRNPTAIFENAVFDGDTRIRIGIDAGSSTTGYQGYHRNIDPSTEVSAQFYLPSDWGTTGTVRTGIWAAGYNEAGTQRFYPILEYDKSVGFKAWDEDTGWNTMALPSDADTNTWYTLSIKLETSSVVYTVTGTRANGTSFDLTYTDTSVTTSGTNADNSSSSQTFTNTIGSELTFRNVILMSRSDNTSTYSAYWDNITTNAGSTDSSVLASASASAGTSVAISGLEVRDRDGGTLTTVLSSSAGTMTVTTGGGATITGDGSGSVTLQGTESQINAALAGLTFTGSSDVYGSQSITVKTTDSGGLSDTDTIALTFPSGGGSNAQAPSGPAPTTAPPTTAPTDGGDADAAPLVTVVRDTAPTTVTDTGADAGDAGQGDFAGTTGDAAQRAAPGDTAPTTGGFQIASIAQAAGTAGTAGDVAALVAVRPVTDVAVTDNAIRFSLPADTFAAQAETVVQLTATLDDGRALPSWLAFDPQTGTFVGTPPASIQGEIVIRVTARDRNGQEAVALVRFDVAGNNARPSGPAEKGAPDNGGERPAPGQTGEMESGPDAADTDLAKAVGVKSMGKTAFVEELQVAGRQSAVRQAQLLAAARQVARHG